MEIKSNGKYRITHNNIEYDLESGCSYTLDEETAKMFVENGYCNYSEVKNGTNKSKKTNASKQ
jgi:hypothetical protein